MIITQTPLRISLLGGGSDFPDFYKRYGGCVLSMAIDKYIYCIVKKRFDNLIYVNYSKKEIVKNVDMVKHDLVREALKLTGIKDSIEISFLSDIPAAGSGLGSSSSVTVGVLHALYLYQGMSVTAKLLAEQACQIELKILKRPIGVQDQYIASYGGISFMSFSKHSIRCKKINLSSGTEHNLERQLLVVFTGQTRESKDVLEEQKAKIKTNKQALTEISKLAKKGRKLLEKDKIQELGVLLDENWQLKKGLASKITNVKIDKMYQSALEAGASGGKISGAGNGGFLTLIVPEDKRQNVIRSLKNFQQLPISFSTDGSKSIFNIKK
jgi:D-glycero-alpha-D-manno-heptose-7-phosphate kinase